VPLDVVQGVITPPVTTFTFMVPGHQRWQLRSVVATVARAAGGTPNRSYSLTVANGQTVVASAPAADTGTEPGTGTVTWADAPSNVLASGTVMSSLAPLPRLVIPAGYVVTGTIINPAGADTWASAIVWVEYVNAD